MKIICAGTCGTNIGDGYHGLTWTVNNKKYCTRCCLFEADGTPNEVKMANEIEDDDPKLL